jgi:hypothetical protein
MRARVIHVYAVRQISDLRGHNQNARIYLKVCPAQLLCSSI